MIDTPEHYMTKSSLPPPPSPPHTSVSFFEAQATSRYRAMSMRDADGAVSFGEDMDWHKWYGQTNGPTDSPS